MLRNMADAYKIQALAGERLTAWQALHAATRGAARALGLGRRDRLARAGPQRPTSASGTAAVGPVATRRAAVARSLHERVFAWMTLADERNLVQTWVAGVLRHERAGA